ncbi:helix-turn-helix domain-containing protein [Altererythrobacter litoralis]|uniref:Helix-turn-helix domain-containing protein n=1 Tax=Altererythrobacter litoralis TaxID=3113904 RepID=A0ABU7GC23_9SPHN|nr:helix-turn-helix domain-containing protein [Erythrobacteraceae bacterium 1XM1-14]
MRGSGDGNGADDAAYVIRSRFFAPPEEFEGCFTSFYRLELDVEGDGRLRDYLQPEWGNIRFFCGVAPWSRMAGREPITDTNFTATGPSSHPTEFELGTVRMWGVGFLPLGWARYIDADAKELSDTVWDGTRHPVFRKFATLREVLCNPGASLEEQFDALCAAMRRLGRRHRDEATIVNLHRALVDEDLGSVAELADRAELTMRSLERICARHFGFTPKLLMRRQRFMRSLTSFMLHKGSKWTDVIDEHYHDQAQFTREFRAFMSMSPSEYAAQDHPILSSFIEARARMWGSPAQTLDRPA